MYLDIGVASRYGGGASKSFISAHRPLNGLCALQQHVSKTISVDKTWTVGDPLE